MIVFLFALAFGNLRARLAAYSIEGLGKYFQADFIPSYFYPHFLPQFLLCSFALQA